MRVWRILAGAALVLLAATPLHAPGLLAFPHMAQVGADRVYSAVPLDPAALAAVLGRADRLTHASPIAEGPEGRDIFITGGDWRWTWLAASSAGAFAISRPFSEAVIVNRADLEADRVYNGAQIGGSRSLSGVIAHEKCHGMLRRHFGLVRAERAPAWLREGYCDHVAQDSSLTEAQVKALDAAGTRHPALPYFHGRQRVADLLESNGGSVDRLFEAAQ